jgi:hypothetical protein
MEKASLQSASRLLMFAVVLKISLVLYKSGEGFAFKLSPNATKLERMNADKYDSAWLTRHLATSGLSLFTEPVHEEIVQRVFGCDAELDDKTTCADLDAEYAGPFIVAGVRWNDDPPFQLSKQEAEAIGCDLRYTIRFVTQVKCWTKLFKIGEERAARGRSLGPKNASLMWRSHLGDLQFLHGMATKDGEPALATQRRILMWAELTWKIASGELRLNQLLKDIPIAGLTNHFGNSGWAIQDLLTLGVPPLRPHIRDVAFGSLIHTIGDSFAAGHVDRLTPKLGRMCLGMPESRAPEPIREFHAYNKQNHKLHGNADTGEAFTQHVLGYRELYRDPKLVDDLIPHSIGIGRTLRAMLYDQQLKWDQVRPYLACIFDIEDPNRPSSPGGDFQITE